MISTVTQEPMFTEKTRSVDVTVTNLLEGVVEFVPEPQQTAQSSTKKVSLSSRVFEVSSPDVV